MADRIRSQSDIDAALQALAAADPRLARAIEAVGTVPLRLHSAGLPGLLRIVTGQQLSTHAAATVFDRVCAAVGSLSPETLGAMDDATLRAAGLSRQKIRTFRASAAAVADGLDLGALADGCPEAARRTLETIPGVGRWTADLYLMFCAGHPDVFPVGDLAVRRGAARALDLVEEPAPAALEPMAEAWRPHRSTAARLMWSVYRLDRPIHGDDAPTTAPDGDVMAGFPL